MFLHLSFVADRDYVPVHYDDVVKGKAFSFFRRGKKKKVSHFPNKVSTVTVLFLFFLCQTDAKEIHLFMGVLFR